jgi:hypothetical protein
MVVLMSPSPAGTTVKVSSPSWEARAAGACSEAFDAANGPWAVERMLAPYPDEIAPCQLPAFDLRPARPMGAQAAVDPALGPWDVDRLLCPYPGTMGFQQLAELAPQPVMPAARLAPQPSAPIESGLERLLYPYPDAVAPGRLSEFSRRPDEPMGPAASAARPGAPMRIVMRVAGTTRKLMGLAENGTQTARKAVKDLRQPETPTWGGNSATPDRGGQAMPIQTDDAREGLKQLIEALDAFAPRPASWPDDDRGSFLLPWHEMPQTASDPFALDGRCTDADDELTVVPLAILPADCTSPPRHVAGLDGVFPSSTGVAFVAALLLLPLSCSYAAGAVYGYARDGPSRRS